MQKAIPRVSDPEPSAGKCRLFPISRTKAVQFVWKFKVISAGRNGIVRVSDCPIAFLAPVKCQDLIAFGEA